MFSWLTGQLFTTSSCAFCEIHACLRRAILPLLHIQEGRDEFDWTANQWIDGNGLPAIAASRARDRRSRHGAPRRLLHHGRVPAIAASRDRDRRSRHGAPRRLLHHGRVPAALLETSTVTRMN